MNFRRAGWKKHTIQDVYLEFYDGLHATPNPAEEGPVFLGIKNITEDGKLDLTEVRHIAEEDFDKWTRRVLPHPGDIVFSYEATLNLYAIIPEGFRGCLGRRLALLRPNPQVVDTCFLFYYFFGPEWRATIAKNLVFGSTVDRVPLIRFPNFEISLPSLSMQRKIAGILSAYDDLIENNTRRIKILEEMARRVYREWFVLFRFPGSEQVRMADSPLGKIPTNWDIVRVGERFTTVLGGTPSRNKPEFWKNGTVPWINSSKVNELRVIEASEFITAEGLRRSSTKMMPRQTTLVAITGATLGQVSLLEIEACANQSVVGIYDEQSLFSEYIYLVFREIITAVIQHASGGAQQHINKEIVNAVQIVLPPLQTASQLQSFVRPMFDMIANLMWKNANLRRTRDLLLPRLVSGELDVENVEVRMAANEFAV